MNSFSIDIKTNR